MSDASPAGLSPSGRKGADPAVALGKRLIFTITTGRSGTRYLAWVLRGFRDVDARHEPRPKFSGAFRTVAQFPHTAEEFWRHHKLPRIARSPRPIYAETSHLAGKGFLESLIAMGGRPDLIHLHRAPRDVARSLWRLGTVPGRTYRGAKYYLAPTDRCLCPLPPERIAGLHDYQLCFWYCLEIAARARGYAAAFAVHGVQVHDVPLTSIESREGILALGRRLSLGPHSTMKELALRLLDRRRRNRKDDRKQPHSLPEAELDSLEDEVRALTGAAEVDQSSGV